MQTPRNSAPLLVAAALLLIPVLYIGSYFALVNPNGHFASRAGQLFFTHYRVGNEVSRTIFWPLEQIDRRLRPQIWKDGKVILQ